MNNRLLSALLAALMLISLVPAPARAAADPSVSAAEYGWDEMRGDLALRVTENGVDVARLVVGEEYKLQVWLQDIAPYAVMVPICWDPSVIEVINPNTGDAVESGKKTEKDVGNGDAGFRTGSGCWGYGYDPRTYQPLYWNGRPVYTVSNEEDADAGYPYLNAERGSYRFFYYVTAPNAPAKAQMFIEISFRVIGVGDPDIHIASQSDGAGRYDPAQPDGASAVIADGDNGVVEMPYGTSVSAPDTRAMTKEDYDAQTSTDTGIDQWVHDNLGETGSTGTTHTPYTPPQPVKNARTTPAVHLECFPYDSVLQTEAVLMTTNGMATEESQYILPSNLITEAINQNGGGLGLLALMPKRILNKDTYEINFEMRNIDDMVRTGMYMLYFETPWAYVGLNTVLLKNNLSDSDTLLLTVTPSEDGITAALTVNGKNKVSGFTGHILRLIVPYKAEEGDGDTIPVPTGSDVFGDGSHPDQPLSLYKVDDDNGALIILAPGFCSYTIGQASPISFEDMENHQWAQDAVAWLSQHGIVNGASETAFDPGGAVTRAQLATMLVRGLGMYTAADDGVDFADVPYKSFYQAYVSSARIAGLVNGIGDGLFGTDNPITREDLCVMAYRGLTQLGVALPAERAVNTFADDESISQYAREAVYSLYRAGIIDGVGNNTFDPAGGATRAEAAKILYGVLQYTVQVF